MSISFRKRSLIELMEERLEYNVQIWYNSTRPQGWMFKTDKTDVQRLGFRYNQVVKYIMLSPELDHLKIYLHKEK